MTDIQRTAEQPPAPIALKIEHLWVVKGGGLFAKPKAILQDVSFEVQPGAFVAVIGPNGAGKTTLFKALVNEKPTHGRVLVTQGDASEYEDLYANPEYWLQQIGYVPVDNVLHEELTVRQALEHVARLRLPGRSDGEIWQIITEKLKRLGFAEDDERLDRLVKSLSSGERKKINVAAELLTNPPLLLLDEPTSNLDPNAERDLMNALRNLSGEQNDGRGPTILLITHTLESLDRCSYVVFVANAKLCASGTPEQVLQRLRQSLPADQRPPAEANPFEVWAAIFDHYKTVETAKNVAVQPAHLTPVTSPQRERQLDNFGRQFRILFSRYFLMRYNDLTGVGTILWTGFFAGFLLLIAPSDVFLKARDASNARQTVVLCVILTVIVAIFNSQREISKEFRIYIHERAKGLDPMAYLSSKIVWLSGVIGAFTTLILLALMGFPIARGLCLLFAALVFLAGLLSTLRDRRLGRRLISLQRMGRIAQFGLIASPLLGAFLIQLQDKQLPTTPPIGTQAVEVSIIATLLLTSWAALTAGLVVSAGVGGNNDRATQLAIGVIVVNVIMAFAALVGGTPAFRALFDTLQPLTATHFGYRGFASSLSIYCWASQFRLEEFNSLGHLIAVWLYLLVHFLVAVGACALLLRLQEKWTTPAKVLQRALLKERTTWAILALLVGLLSWSNFLVSQSEAYASLTFHDMLFGGDRYARIESVDQAQPLQRLIGQLSSSACGITPVDDGFALSLVPRSSSLPTTLSAEGWLTYVQ